MEQYWVSCLRDILENLEFFEAVIRGHMHMYASHAAELNNNIYNSGLRLDRETYQIVNEIKSTYDGIIQMIIDDPIFVHPDKLEEFNNIRILLYDSIRDKALYFEPNILEEVAFFENKRELIIKLCALGDQKWTVALLDWPLLSDNSRYYLDWFKESREILISSVNNCHSCWLSLYDSCKNFINEFESWGTEDFFLIPYLDVSLDLLFNEDDGIIPDLGPSLDLLFSEDDFLDDDIIPDLDKSLDLLFNQDSTSNFYSEPFSSEDDLLNVNKDNWYFDDLDTSLNLLYGQEEEYFSYTTDNLELVTDLTESLVSLFS